MTTVLWFSVFLTILIRPHSKITFEMLGSLYPVIFYRFLLSGLSLRGLGLQQRREGEERERRRGGWAWRRGGGRRRGDRYRRGGGGETEIRCDHQSQRTHGAYTIHHKTNKRLKQEAFWRKDISHTGDAQSPGVWKIAPIQKISKILKQKKMECVICLALPTFYVS